MKPIVLNVLCCPFCGGSFTVDAGKEVRGELEYAILKCHCARYPVVNGIPILKKVNVSVTHSVEGVLDLIEAGRYRDALLAALMPPAPDKASFAPGWMKPLSVRGMGRVKRFLGKSGLQKWREQVEAVLTAPKDKISVSDFLDVYLQQQNQSSNYNYFAYRLSQPRYLVALSLASLVQKTNGPVLDLACGFGNITRYLARQAKGQLVVGIDQNFYGLHCAKDWLAPGPEYVCADVDVSLPVADRTCAFTYCSDAFHLFLHQSTVMHELKRVTDDTGVLVLTSVPNGLVKTRLNRNSIIPSLPIEGYEALLADLPYRLVDYEETLDLYLKKQGPNLSSSARRDRLARSQWVSIVATTRHNLFADYGAFQDWPHVEVDRLGLNPLYKVQDKDHLGNVVMRREFPTTWYAAEDAIEGGRYVPETVLVTSKVMTELAEGRRSREIEELIERGVVVGIPENYFHLSA